MHAFGSIRVSLLIVMVTGLASMAVDLAVFKRFDFMPGYFLIAAYLFIARTVAALVAPGVPRLVGAADCLVMTYMALIVVLYVSHQAIAVSSDPIDAMLLAADRSLGFDPAAFLSWVNGEAWAEAAFRYAYQTYRFQLIGTAFVLLIWARPADVDRFFLAFLLCCLVASAICAAFPAFGIAVSLDFARDYPNIDPVGLTPVDAMRRMHGDPAVRIGGEQFRGMISFPSMHAAGGVLVSIALRHLPLLFWPVLLINLCMIPATIPMGGHYLVDALAGVVLAPIAFVAAEALRSRLDPVAARVFDFAPFAGLRRPKPANRRGAT
ncbi:phosphatase PAP2 family protein [Prosthecomicrobium sp. N25]|uniref:phosphatase PAP2 family protein n=1 Tax=Prosthecomicrobium sp. N25 TaxID=3129254 RepID=UPI003077864C